MIYLDNFCICFRDLSNNKNFSFYLPKHLESFEINVPKYLLFIRIEQLWYMNVFYPQFQFLTLQHWEQQLIKNDKKQVKLEEVLEQEKIQFSSEQPIEQKSTTKLVDQDQKKQIKKTRKKNSKKIYNNGHWTQKEHRLYLQFIEKNREIMMKSDMKKQEKIFKQMSHVIKSRSPSQCRSHHQKFNPF